MEETMSPEGIEESKDRARWKHVVRSYLIKTPDTLCERLQQYAARSDISHREIVMNFIENIHSIGVTLTLPFTLVMSGVNRRRIQLLSVAEHIRSGLHVAERSEESDQMRIEIDKRVRDEFYQTLDGDGERKNSIISEVVDELYGMAVSADFREGPREIILQGIVSLWTCFEVFVTDYLRAMLNENAELAVGALSVSSSKRHFDGIYGKEAIPLGILQTHGFDLSHRMGDVLMSGRRFDSMSMIRDVTNVVLPSALALQTELRSPDLWMLNQRRHLIVHRRGIVDEAYLRNTPDRAPIGSPLQPTSKELESYIAAVERASIELIAAVSASKVKEP